jgi:hypothetical protein
MDENTGSYAAVAVVLLVMAGAIVLGAPVTAVRC